MRRAVQLDWRWEELALIGWHGIVLRWSHTTDAQTGRNRNTAPNTYAAIGTWHIQAWTPPGNFNEMKTLVLVVECLFL